MTKNDKNPPKTTEEKELQEILNELETEQKDSIVQQKEAKGQKEIAKLQQLLTEKEEIAKKAQIDYINLKADFDFLVRQTQMKERMSEQENLLKVVKKLLPFVEDLRKSLENLSPEQKEEPLGRGVTIVYTKFISALAELQIFPVESLGLDPDSLFHEPVSMQPTTDKKLK